MNRPPPRSRPTIEDVAAASGVSVATVSRALRGLPNVAPATRERVLAAAAELEYETDPQASRLASGRTMTVGLVAPLFGTWHADRVVTGAESIFADAGLDLLVAPVRDVQTLGMFLDRARSFGRRVDGVLLIDLYVDSSQSERLEAMGVPMVSVGEELGSAPSVTIDNVAAARTATTHLVELGHTRVGLIGGAHEGAILSPVPAHREQGWREALVGSGLSAGEDLVVDGGFTVEGGAAALADLLDGDHPPTAVFCMSDRMALGAMTEAWRRGLRVPGDLAVVGFDDDDLAAAFDITTMRQPVADLGVRAASMLVGLISGEDPAVGGTAPVELIVRATTAPPA